MGKWHLGADPTKQGFDINVGGTTAGHPKSYFSPYRNRNLKDGPKGEHLCDRLAAEASRFVAEQARDGKPFFLYLPFYSVHTPIRAKKELIEKYEKKKPGVLHQHAVYAAMLETMDAGLGTVMAALKESGQLNNTLVLFTADNGHYGPVSSAKPLRGSKGMLYEGGVREPMVASWQGVIPAGSTCEEPVIGIDFFPTMLELAGAPAPEDHVLDGVSLMPLFKGQRKTLEREALFWHFPAYLQGYRKGMTWRTTPAGSVRMGDWKLIEFFEDGKLELYHLAEDLGETKNLAASRPEKRDQLHAALKGWRKRVQAPVPSQRNPDYLDPAGKAEK